MSFEEDIEESRQRLGVPDDWEWYRCANDCGDVVWVPPQVGDMPIAPVCTVKCLHEFIQKKERPSP